MSYLTMGDLGEDPTAASYNIPIFGKIFGTSDSWGGGASSPSLPSVSAPSSILPPMTDAKAQAALAAPAPRNPTAAELAAGSMTTNGRTYSISQGGPPLLDRIGGVFSSLASGVAAGLKASAPPPAVQQGMYMPGGARSSGLPSWAVPVGIGVAAIATLAVVMSATRSNPPRRIRTVLRKVVFGGYGRRSGHARAGRYVLA